MDIYIKRDDGQFGPFSPEQIEECLESGALIETDIAWHAALPRPTMEKSRVRSTPRAACTVRAESWVGCGEGRGREVGVSGATGGSGGERGAGVFA